MIKLLALDLDGTLLNSQGKITDENKLAIEKAEKLGVLVTIATGRRFRDARPVALEGNFNAPILTHNGALIKYAESLKTVASSLISIKTTKEILRVGKNFGSEPLVSADPIGKGTLYYENVSEDNIPLQRYILWSKLLHGKEAEDALHHVNDLHSILEETEIIHISYSGTCNEMNDLQKILKEKLQLSVNILSTVYPKLNFTLLDILPPKTSKGEGLNKLAAINNLKPENVMVVGDNFNDLEMLEYAGTSVVMGNADASLLEREEFYTTLSNNENGVAAAINKHILGE